MRFTFIFKCLFALALGAYALRGAFLPQAAWLLDGANLLFHEAGHVLFSFLGEGVSIAGGTLMQLLIPAGLAVGFFRQSRPYSAGMMLIWLGQNFFGISVYMNDARTRILPLVGGEIHDWGYLLGKAGLLQYDHMLSGCVWILGLLTVLAAIPLSFYFAWIEAKRDEEMASAE